MKETFRQSMAWLHSWVGLLTGWVLFFVFVMGAATLFDMEVTRWMSPELPMRQDRAYPAAPPMIEKALDFLAAQPEQTNKWKIHLPGDGRRSGCGFLCRGGEPWRGYNSELIVKWDEHVARLDPDSGKALPPLPVVRDTEGGELFYEMHHALHYLDDLTGQRIIAIAVMLGLLATVSGVIVHKKIFADFFMFRPGKGQRSWLDGHNLLGVITLPFFLMILYSGLLFQGYLPKPFLSPPAPKEVARSVDAADPPAAVTRPSVPMATVFAQAERHFGKGEVRDIEVSRAGDGRLIVSFSRAYGAEYPLLSRDSVINFDAATGAYRDIPVTFGQTPPHQGLWYLTTAHNAWFAGAGLRWLLFIASILTCGMIATGMVLWTVKRREKYARQGRVPFGVPMVEHLNAGVIAGLPVGIAAYFWANRLLPVSLAERAGWEANILFATWGWMIVYALLRPAAQAWRELFWVAAAVAAAIPIINALTTDRHLGVTLRYGDWVLAGFDLTMLGFAALFAFCAFKLGGRAKVGARV
ncbi:membrane protein [Sphingobium jiangsuense]|uniref:Putative iron-regulated membrane protein n=1 Tax=Sphingobium jiangsuense TaxID=870476 RepID=A0A7W6BNV9_9SPHN|nr:PepSY-associated TM helix domain-containing protein [Sphingobium jiangsuense]MBB3928622.1 putative iron-regulated membrane protein [Sphingobium jiangsuense]GLT01013.1 membrane protein [Sphingobium jiangsuense]